MIEPQGKPEAGAPNWIRNGFHPGILRPAGRSTRADAHFAVRKRHTPVSSLAWIAAAVYTFLLLSRFSLDLFTISGSYFAEFPLLLCVIFGLIVKDPIAQLTKLALVHRPKWFFVAVGFALFLFVAGGLTGGNFSAAYADLRASLLLFLGFRVTSVARRYGRQHDLLPLALCCAIAPVVYWCIATMSGTYFLKYPAPYFAGVIGIVLGAEIRVIKFVLISLVCILFMASVSFLRQYYFVAVLATILAVHYFFSVFTGRSRLRAWLAVAVLCVVGIGFGHVYIENLISFYSGDEARYIQSIGKSVDILNAVQGTGMMNRSDSLRFGYFAFIVEKPFRLILPHGLGYRSFIDNLDPYFRRYNTLGVNSIDSLVLYVAYHYGLVTCIPLCIWLWRSFRLRLKRSGVVSSTLLYSILLIPMLFDGGQATVLSRAFWLGSFVGLITYIRTTRLSGNGPMLTTICPTQEEAQRQAVMAI